MHQRLWHIQPPRLPLPVPPRLPLRFVSLQELLQQEPNVTHVKAPVVVVGDTHGQFHDLLEIFKIAGAPRCQVTKAMASFEHSHRPATLGPSLPTPPALA
jgi:hypothetical protein